MVIAQDLLKAVLEPLGIIIHYVLGAYIWVLVIRAVLSWVSPAIQSIVRHSWI
jgi:uncharacterized protein YggT (Ycf19 family)